MRAYLLHLGKFMLVGGGTGAIAGFFMAAGMPEGVPAGAFIGAMFGLGIVAVAAIIGVS